MEAKGESGELLQQLRLIVRIKCTDRLQRLKVGVLTYKVAIRQQSFIKAFYISDGPRSKKAVFEKDVGVVECPLRFRWIKISVTNTVRQVYTPVRFDNQ